MKPLELAVPPVAQVAVVAVGMWALSGVAPALALPVGGAWGIAFMVLGAAVSLSGVLAFRRARTTVDPRAPEKTATLVTNGVYRLSRNPMYLGFALGLFGWSLFLANGLSLLLLPVFVAYMNRFQIAPEERHMQAKFGAAFTAYAAKVRRWL